MKKIRSQKIRIKGVTGKMEFGGWLSGRSTYLRVQKAGDTECDYLDGVKLYRLAKAIVRRFEGQS